MAGQDDSKKSSDVKASFAWGQLFVGSILAGFAVFQLGLKITNTPPSEILLGWVNTYRAVRDFLMLPFDWVQLNLLSNEKDALLVWVILFGAQVRAAMKTKHGRRRHPFGFFELVNIVFIHLLMALFFGWLAMVLPSQINEWTISNFGMRLMFVLPAFIVVSGSILLPISTLVRRRYYRHLEDRPLPSPRPETTPPEHTARVLRDASPMALLTLLNILFTALWGAALLLLNSASSNS